MVFCYNPQNSTASQFLPICHDISQYLLYVFPHRSRNMNFMVGSKCQICSKILPKQKKYLFFQNFLGGVGYFDRGVRSKNLTQTHLYRFCFDKNMQQFWKIGSEMLKKYPFIWVIFENRPMFTDFGIENWPMFTDFGIEDPYRQHIPVYPI